MLINPNSINLSALPSAPLNDNAGLPPIAAIYFAIDSLGVVQYVGQTTNLRQRWQNHHRRSQLEPMGIKLAWLEIREIGLLNQLEAEFIQRFNPPLNNTAQDNFPDWEPPMEMVDINYVSQIAWNPQLGGKLRQLRGEKVSLALLTEKLEKAGVLSDIGKLETGRVEAIAPTELKTICRLLNSELGQLIPTVQIRYQHPA